VRDVDVQKAASADLHGDEDLDDPQAGCYHRRKVARDDRVRVISGEEAEC
jgi:hypothetical protein